MQAVPYSEFSLRLHRQAQARRIPMVGAIELTQRCPMACVHCYNNLPLDDATARSAELTAEEHCRILDEIAEAGCLWLLFTGGEIFARPDFLDIYTYAKRKGLLITLFTNGTLITPEIADHLAEWRPFSIEITIYGRTRDTHERITRVAGSFDRCMRGIQLLLERRLPLALKTIVMTLNRHEIGEMKRFVEEDLGLPFRFDAMINCRTDCSRGPLAVRLSPEEIVDLDLRDPKRVAEWRRFAERFNGPVHSPEQSDDLYFCGAGINLFGIDSFGQMDVCLLSRTSGYDLRSGSFDEGWKTHLQETRRKKITRQTKCVACEIKAVCGMCPANGWLESGDEEEPVEFLCEVAHRRAKALGLPIPEHDECAYCRREVAGREREAASLCESRR
jgi:radical SAM protein with 4Fe4S-binding SPASM domain